MAKQDHLTKEQFSRLIAHAWTDPAFKKHLERDPTGAIRHFANDRLGVDVAHPMHFPDRPDELTDEQLHAAASGDKVLGMAPKTSCI